VRVGVRRVVPPESPNAQLLVVIGCDFALGRRSRDALALRDRGDVFLGVLGFFGGFGFGIVFVGFHNI